MLPGTGGVGVAHADGLAGLQGADAVGHDAIERPVPAADDVARAGAGDFDGMPGEERAAVGGDGQLRHPFAGAVGIEAAHRVFFPVAVHPFAVFVALVGGDENGGARFAERAQGFEDVDGPHDVGGVGLHRFLVGEADEGLRGEVEDEVGLDGLDAAAHEGGVADVADLVVQSRSQAELIKKGGVALRLQREPMHPGSEQQ